MRPSDLFRHRDTAWMPFSDFMRQVLYDPVSGYYQKPHPVFGPSGDFTTAPECTPLFAHCLARQCAPVLRDLTHPTLLEIGCGSGILAAHLLLALEAQNALPQQYHLLDISPTLQAIQRKTLMQYVPHLMDRIHFQLSPPQAPFEGIILGNEVLDALPIDRFIITSQQVMSYGVGLSHDQLIWQTQPATQALFDATAFLDPSLYPADYVSEVCLNLSTWHTNHTQMLQRGIVLWIDYGHTQSEYYMPYRNQGTLHCHYQHQIHHDPFQHLGEQDITAQVNFTALAEAALFDGFEVTGFTDQAHFLAGCGINECLQSAIEHSPAQTLSLQHQAKRLTHPQLMGTAFKILGLAKNYTASWIGFQYQNHLYRL